MKKSISSRLNTLAAAMPTVFHWELAPEVFTGEEMNLSGFGEQEKFDPTKAYTVNMPVMVAVEHKQQIKDAYKRGGAIAVKEYYHSVKDKIKSINDNHKLPA